MHIPRFFHLLGVVPDEVLAQRMGTTIQYIKKKRNSLGIPGLKIRTDRWIELEKLNLLEFIGIDSAKLKEIIINELGAKCSLCGHEDMQVLQIDHVNGGGRKHRTKATCNRQYYIEILISVRDGKNEYQVLCANCNWGKSMSKYSGKSEASQLRRLAIKELGDKCNACGCDRIPILQIDHIAGGGKKEKTEYQQRHSKEQYYNMVIRSARSKNGKFQLLCANCNWKKRFLNNEATGRPKRA